jgi:biopolymer transport protein ExbD
MRRKIVQPSEEEAQINLTPLIDVVFVVLIMFILIAPILQCDQIQLAKASPLQQVKKLPQEANALAIHVRADNTIWVGGKKLTEKELIPFFIKERNKGLKKSPQLFHDKKAYFGTYQNVKNALEAAGFEEMDLILEPN